MVRVYRFLARHLSSPLTGILLARASLVDLSVPVKVWDSRFERYLVLEKLTSSKIHFVGSLRPSDGISAVKLYSQESQSDNKCIVRPSSWPSISSVSLSTRVPWPESEKYPGDHFTARRHRKQTGLQWNIRLSPAWAPSTSFLIALVWKEYIFALIDCNNL